MEFPRKVLEYYWPEADSHIDICKTDFKKYANRIDILTGGFPCQPFSLAGKRKGTDDERYLWGEMLRAIQEIKPTWVIAENVFGIVNIDGGLVFEQVCLDLEAQGYEVQPFIIPACAKNAPHRRDRVWFIAYTNGTKQRNNPGTNNAEKGEIWGDEESDVFGELCSNGDATNTNSTNNQTRSHGKILGQSHRQKTDGHSNVERTNQWENFPTQSPICGGDDGIPTKLDGITFSKWRQESVKGYGNAIVPQIALQLFQIIEHESKNKNT